MPGRRFRALAALAVVIGCAAAGLPGAAAAARGGGQLTVIASRTHRSPREMLVIRSGGHPASAMVGATDVRRAERLTWSPDGREYAFIDPGVDLPTVQVARAGATEALELGEPAYGDFPLFNPRGDVVFATQEIYDRPPGIPDYEPWGIYGTVLWAAPVDGSESRQLGVFGPGVLVDPYSSATDGRIAATASIQQGGGIAVIPPGTATLRWVLGPGPGEFTSPAISPDGSQIVFLRDQLFGPFPRWTRIRSTQVISVPTRGGKPEVLATIPGGARWPSWDPSGSRLSLTALGVGETSKTGLPGPHSALIEMNSDGTCLTTVYAAKDGGAVWGSAWRPRPVRAVGPLSC